MKSGIRLLLLALILPGVAAAQVAQAPDALPSMDDPQMAPLAPAKAPRPGPDLGKWWKNSEIAKHLQLSDSQVSQIEQTFLDHRLKLIDLRADVERQEAKLQPLIEADQPDEAKVSAQLDLLLAARNRLEKANAMMMLSIRKILSVEQWKKLEAIKEQREGPMPMRMHGPPAPAARPPGPGAPTPDQRRPPDA
jgi:Spy/CpxP family protein refolding chaperone